MHIRKARGSGGASCRCLKAGGAEVLIDHERFEAGLAVVGQMDGLQDQAERQLICWSADHAASNACGHEWRRALAKDPGFQSGLILLARRDGHEMPAEIPTRPESVAVMLWRQSFCQERLHGLRESLRDAAQLELRHR